MRAGGGAGSVDAGAAGGWGDGRGAGHRGRGAPLLTDAGVGIAAVNGPRSVVVAGDEAAVLAVAERFGAGASEAAAGVATRSTRR